MAPAKNSAKSSKPSQKPVKSGSKPEAGKSNVAKKESVKGTPKTNVKPAPAKSAAHGAAKAKEAPKKSAAPAKPAAKAAPAKAGGKAAPASAKKPAVKAAPAKKPAAEAKGKKEDPKAAKTAPAKVAANGKKAPAPAPAKTGAKPAEAKGAKGASPAKAAAPAKAPAAGKAPAIAKTPVEKPAKAPRAAKVPVVKGPMEKAQRSLAASAARAAGKDKIPPSKSLAATAKVVAAAEVKTAKKAGKVFFQEVVVGAERIIKRGDKTTTSPIPADVQSRRRGSGGEESPEELVERIERELEHQHIFKRNMLKPQLCTKCGINAVSERFTIDKELGYCDDCAEILHLGETKEARKIDFHPSLMKKDGEAKPEGEEDDDEEEEGPPSVVPDIDV